MKKFVLFLLGVAIFVAAVFVAAPVLAGAAISGTLLYQGVKLVATTTGIPAWAAVLIFIALIPSALWWCFQMFTPKVQRRWVAILIAVGVMYALATAALSNQHLVAAAHSAAAAIQKLLVPLKPADPATEAWFFPDGQARLFYVHPATNVWTFYQGACLAGTHDAVTGTVLLSVTPAVRQEWAAAQEMAKEQAAAERRAAEELQRDQELAAATQKQAEERRVAEEAAAERSRLEQQVAAQQQKVDEMLQKLEASAQQQSQPVGEQRQPDPPPVPTYTSPPAVPTTTYVVNVAPSQPVYYYTPPPPPQVRYYYYYYPAVRNYWVAPRPYLLAPSAPRYYYRRW